MDQREKIYNQISTDLQQPLDVVETVVSWAYKSANKAVKVHNELEISGLGTSLVSNNKVKKRIAIVERIEQRMIKSNHPKLQGIQDYLKQLKERWTV